MLGTLHADVELTIFEHIDGRTHPVRVRDPREWAAALNVAQRLEPDSLGGLLEWACSRCGAACHAELATLAPISFARPEVHWCEPTGLRRLTELLTSGYAAGYAAVAPLPPLPTLPVALP